ncbi:hypothetical protein SDC9_135953 [bioreactor metagenome]|uniref:Uncharacterized protein n=1 Tax=bioreactor metagenome TaxID=1076179 RepID=A0A645DHS7_9ZZZZ
MAELFAGAVYLKAKFWSKYDVTVETSERYKIPNFAPSVI